MKEDKLNNLFDKIRSEKLETSPDQVASWLNLPAAAPSSNPDFATNTFFTSKTIIIMSIITSTIIATILIFSPGKSVEIPVVAEFNVTNTRPHNESNHSTPEISSPVISETSSDKKQPQRTASTPNIVTRSTVEVPALSSPAKATLTPDSKSQILLSPLNIMPNEVNSPAAQILKDTLFSNVETIELNCSSCRNTRFNSHQSDRVRFKGEIITSDSDSDQPKPEFLFERDGNTLIVTFKPAAKKNKLLSKTTKTSVDILFEIPAGVNITSNITYGNIAINGIENDFCNLKISSGDVTVQNAVSKFQISSTYGNQNYKNILGPLQLSSSSGNVQLENITGNISLKNTYGKIDINQIAGDVDIKGSSSNITAHNVKGAVNMLTTYGNISLEKIVGNVNSKVSSGNIRVDQLKGDLKTENTYGQQDFSNILGHIVSTGSSSNYQLLTILGDIKIKTTYGNVLLDSSKGNVDISASNGNVDGVNVELSEMMNISLTYGNIKMKLNNRPTDLTYNLASNSGNLKIKSLGLNSKKTINYGSGPVQINATTISGNQEFE